MRERRAKSKACCELSPTQGTRTRVCPFQPHNKPLEAPDVLSAARGLCLVRVTVFAPAVPQLTGDKQVTRGHRTSKWRSHCNPGLPTLKLPMLNAVLIASQIF